MIVSLLENIKKELQTYADTPHGGGIDNVKTIELNQGIYDIIIFKSYGVALTSEIRAISIYTDSNRRNAILTREPWEPEYVGLYLKGVPVDTFYELFGATGSSLVFGWSSTAINARVIDSVQHNINMPSSMTPGVVMVNK